jgi:hypothetical protein
VPDDQLRVDQANAGDTISVAAGTYTESVTVTNQLSLVGSGPTTTIIDVAAGCDSERCYNGIVISGSDAAGTIVTGFSVENAGLEGILALDTSNLTIAGNRLLYNDAFGPFSTEWRRGPRSGRLRRGLASTDSHRLDRQREPSPVQRRRYSADR